MVSWTKLTAEQRNHNAPAHEILIIKIKTMKPKNLRKLMILPTLLCLLVMTACDKEADPKIIPEQKTDASCEQSQQGLTRYCDIRNTLYIVDLEDDFNVTYIAGYEDNVADPPVSGDYIRVNIFGDPSEYYAAMVAYNEGTTNEKWKVSLSVNAPCDNPDNWSDPVKKNIDGVIKGSTGKDYQITALISWGQESDQSYYLEIGTITITPK